MNRVRACFILGLITIAQASFSQKPSELFPLAAKYPADDGVFLQLREDVQLKIENDSLIAYARNFSQLYMFKDNTALYANKRIPYSGFIELAEFKPVTLLADGNKFKEIPVTDIKDVYEQENGVFYDDTRYKDFIFPSLAKNSIAQLDYTEKINDPRFISPFYFNSYLPVLKATYTVTFPSSIKVSYKLMGTETDKIKFTKKQTDSLTTYTFEAQDLAPWQYEANAPPLSRYNPHIILFVEEAVINGTTLTYLKDVRALYTWYNSLTQGINEKDDAQLIQVVNELTKNKNNESEKVKAIFYWVEDNIKYVAFEAGLEGFIPRQAALVYGRKYGDCKDMASIISNMMKIAGINSNLFWLGTRDIEYTYQEVPSPIADNHMIAVYNDNGKWIFLDGTAQYLTYGYPSDMIQGKQGIVGEGKDKYELVTVPVVPKELNTTKQYISITLDGNMITGTGVVSYYGFPKTDMTFRFKSAQQSKWNELMKKILETGNNKFTVTKYDVRGVNNPDDTLQINYEFAIAGYTKKIEDAYYVNLNLDKTWENTQIDINDRKLPIERNYLYENTYKTLLTIPDGYKVDYIPTDVMVQKDDFGFSIQYTQEGNTVTMTKKLWLNALELPVNKFESWNKMLEQLNAAYKEVVALKQNT